MRSKNLLIFVILGLWVSWGSQLSGIQQGWTVEQVESVLGAPSINRVEDGNGVLVYPGEVRVFIREGVVERFEGRVEDLESARRAMAERQQQKEEERERLKEERLARLRGELAESSERSLNDQQERIYGQFDFKVLGGMALGIVAILGLFLFFATK